MAYSPNRSLYGKFCFVQVAVIVENFYIVCYGKTAILCQNLGNMRRNTGIIRDQAFSSDETETPSLRKNSKSASVSPAFLSRSGRFLAVRSRDCSLLHFRMLA